MNQLTPDPSIEEALRATLSASPGDLDAMRALAGIMERTGRINAALSLRRSILLQSEGAAARAEAQLEFATSLVEAGQPRNALPILQDLLSRDPANEPATFEMGTAFARMEDFKSAATAFAAATQLEPSDTEAQMSAAKSLVTLLRYSDAEPYLSATSHGEDRSAEAHRLMGVIDSHTARNDEAIREFEASITLDPSDAEAQLLLGESLLQEHRSMQALEPLQRAATLHPSVAACFQLVKVYHALGDRDSERAAILSLHAMQEEEAIKRKIAVLRNEAEHAIADGRLIDALHAYESALLLRPTDSETEYRIAMVNGLTGDSTAELEHLKKALNQSPDLPGALSELGRLEGLSGETVSAEHHLRRAIQLDPQRSDALTNLAVLIAKDGDLKQAERLLKDAIECSPSYTGAYRSLGLVYAAEGRPREAERELKQSVTLDGHDPANSLSLGQVYLSEGNFEGAATTFRTAAALAPRNASNHVLLTRALFGMGNLQGALDEVDVALALAPASPELLATINEICNSKSLNVAQKTTCLHARLARVQ